MGKRTLDRRKKLGDNDYGKEELVDSKLFNGNIPKEIGAVRKLVT